MWADPVLLAACLAVGILVALPALQARWRRRVSREWSEVATAFIEYAQAVRREQRRIMMDGVLLARARRLAIPEMITFEFVHDLTTPAHGLLAEAAQRLGLRLKRRVAFERKMLARTAPGRWRGSVAAAAPAVALLALEAAKVAVPPAALLLLLAIESLGCWLLWRLARVEV
jgi:Flp pilus assembly protein TadB